MAVREVTWLTVDGLIDEASVVVVPDVAAFTVMVVVPVAVV